MVRRGLVGRAHEVSVDGRTWTAAGKCAELFAAAQGVVETAEPAQPTAAPADPGPTSQFAPGELLYYQVEGKPYGPMPVALIETLIRNQQVPPDALVWTADSNAEVGASVAAEHPLIGHLFSLENSVAGAQHGSKSKGRGGSGCAMMLVIAMLLCIAAGVWLSIKISSPGTEKKDPPATPSAPPRPPRSGPKES